MELPRKILIGEGVVSQVGSVVRSLDAGATKAAIITGAVVKARAGEECSAQELLARGERRVHGHGRKAAGKDRRQVA
jgi:glycerol dehydrogenase-like iron-containing ADH family enzyme